MAVQSRSLVVGLPALALAGALCFAAAPGAAPVRAPARAAGVTYATADAPGSAGAYSAVAAISAGAALALAAGAAAHARKSATGSLADRTQAKRSAGGAVAMRANPVATFETTMGTFKAEIFLEEMPVTASNFIDLAKTGFYEGIHFHRVIPNFMNQFGCPMAKDPRNPRAGTSGPRDGSSFEVLAGKNAGKRCERRGGGNIPDERQTKIPNEPGTLSMANTGRPNSGGSQFFINVANNSFLNWWDMNTGSAHPVFGKVIENYELVEEISQVPTRNDNPVDPIMMKSITIEGA